MPYQSFTNMEGYLNRLKEEADRREAEERRKEEEEERKRLEQERRDAMLAQWRRSNPMGPPPRDALQPEVQKANRRSAGPHGNPMGANLEVGLTGPAVDTSTPQIGATSPLQSTVAAPPVPPVEPDRPKRDNRPKTPFRYDPLSSAPQPIPAGMPKWGAPPVAGGGVLGVNLAPGIDAATQGASQAIKNLEELGKFIPQGVRDWYGHITNPANPLPGPEVIGLGYDLGQVGAGANLSQAAVEQRAKERSNITAFERGGLHILPGGNYEFGDNQFANAAEGVAEWLGGHPLKDPFATPDKDYEFGQGPLANAAEGFAEFAGRHSLSPLTPLKLAGRVLEMGAGRGLDIVDYQGFLPATTQAIKMGGMSVSNWWGLLSEQQRRVQEQEKSMSKEQKQARRDYWFENPFDINLNGFNSPHENLASTWQMTTNASLEAVRPDKLQEKFNTPEQIAEAKNYANFGAKYGVVAKANIFDNMLNYPRWAEEYSTKAKSIAQQADALPPGNEAQRASLYAEAGRLQAQSIKYKETTPLQIVNEQFNIGGVILDMFTDPTILVEQAMGAAKLWPMMRRYGQGKILSGMAPDALPRFNRMWYDVLEDNPLQAMMQTGRSKSNVDAQIGFSVGSNVLSSATTKGDAKRMLRGVLDGSIAQGIPIAELNGNNAALLDNGDGMATFGRAGVYDWRFIEAQPGFRMVADWLDNFPSLKGDPTDAIEGFFVQNDLISALTRATAQSYKVSKFKDVPYGAIKFNVVQSGANAIVQYVGEGNRVLGQSASVPLLEAQNAAANLGQALRSGKEHQDNFARQVGDLMRNIQSTFSVNTPPQTLGNAIGGNAAAILDGTWAPELMKNNVDWLLNKMGGMYPDARIAEDVGKIQASAKTSSSAAAMPTGHYEGVWGTLLNIASLGIAKPMKALRSGTVDFVGERAMAANIYVTAFKSFFEQEIRNNLPAMVRAELADAVTDPNALNWITDNLVQTAIAGGRLDVAKAINVITSGRISPVLQTLAPTIGDALTGPQILDINNMLAGLNMDNLTDAVTRISTHFQTQREMLQQTGAQFSDAVRPIRNITIDDTKDSADILHSFQNLANQAGLNPDAAFAVGTEVTNLFKQFNQSMLDLAMMQQGNPKAMAYMLDVWNVIAEEKTAVRARNGHLASEAQKRIAALGSATAQGPLPQGRPIPTSILGVGDQSPTRSPTSSSAAGDKKNAIANWIDQITGRTGAGALKATKDRVKAANLYAAQTNIVPPYLLGDLKNAYELDDDRMQKIGVLLSARAKTWAKQTGKSTSDYFRMMTAPSIARRGELLREGIEDRGYLGAFQHDFDRDKLGRIISSPHFYGANKIEDQSKNDSLMTLAHEIGHMFHTDMELVAQVNPDTMVEWSRARQWAGFIDPADKGQYTDQVYAETQNIAMEKFANAFVAYLREGKAPKDAPTGLVAVFERFRMWLTDISEFLTERADNARGLHPDPSNQNIPVFDPAIGDAQNRTFDYLLNPDLSPENGYDYAVPNEFDSVISPYYQRDSMSPPPHAMPPPLTTAPPATGETFQEWLARMPARRSPDHAQWVEDGKKFTPSRAEGIATSTMAAKKGKKGSAGPPDLESILPADNAPAMEPGEFIYFTDVDGPGLQMGRVLSIRTPDLTDYRGYGYVVEMLMEDGGDSHIKQWHDTDLMQQEESGLLIQRRPKAPAAPPAAAPRFAVGDQVSRLNPGGEYGDARVIKVIPASKTKGKGTGYQVTAGLITTTVYESQLAERPGLLTKIGEPIDLATGSVSGSSVAPTKGGRKAAPVSGTPPGVAAAAGTPAATPPVQNLSELAQAGPPAVGEVPPSVAATVSPPVPQGTAATQQAATVAGAWNPKDSRTYQTVPGQRTGNDVGDGWSGWKLHLTTDKGEEVSAILKEMGLRHKVGRNAGQTGKDVTIYVGGRKDADAAAALIESQLAGLIKKPTGEALTTDRHFSKNVVGRFDAGGLTDFHQYGLDNKTGVPLLKVDQGNLLASKHGTPWTPIDRGQAQARAERYLLNTFGDYFRGDTPKARMTPPAGIPGVTPPAAGVASVAPPVAPKFAVGDKVTITSETGNLTPGEVIQLIPVSSHPTGSLGDGVKVKIPGGATTTIFESQMTARPNILTKVAPPPVIPPANVPPPSIPTGAPPPPAVPPTVPPVPPNGVPPIPPAAAVPPPPNPVLDSIRAQSAQIWKETFEAQHQNWIDFGRRSGDFMERVRVELPNIQEQVKQGLIPRLEGLIGPNGEEVDIAALDGLSNLSVDMDEMFTWLNTKVGWQSKDPNFDVKVKALAKDRDAMQQRMMLMLFHHPNEASYSEFLQAFADVAQIKNDSLGRLYAIRGNIEKFQAEGDAASAARWFDILKEQNNIQWGKYWEGAIERFWAGAVRIAEVNLPPSMLDDLTFRPTGEVEDWTLIGPHFLQAGQWRVKAPNGSITFQGVKKGQVPKELVDRYNSIRKAAELSIMQAVEDIGMLAAREPGGMPATDELIKRMKIDPHAKAALDDVRRRVAENLANYSAQHYVPADLPGQMLQSLNAGEAALLAGLRGVAQLNTQGFGRMGLDMAGKLNRRILPLFDNIVTGAQKYGKEAVSFGMVDFSKEYHPDVLLGLYAPFHYWWSRMGKNALERMLFKPHVGSLMSLAYRSVEAQNRAEDQPNRNIDTIPWGIPIGDTVQRIGMAVIPRWIPWYPAMVMNGWANPDLANRAFDYMQEATQEQAFPATMKGLAGAMMASHEAAQQMGLNSFPFYDDLAEYAATGKVNLQGRLGDISSLYRTLGWGATAYTNWMKENGHPINPTFEQALDALGYWGLPEYATHLYAREAGHETVRGNLSEDEGGFVQDVLRQQKTGEAPLPEQALLAPQAEQQTAAVKARVAIEYFVKSLIAFTMGVPIATVYKPEMEMRAAKAERDATRYRPVTQEAGSESAYFGMTDPNAENYSRGLRTYNSRYAASLEAAPQRADPLAERPAKGAIQSNYYTEQSAIYDKYNKLREETYAAHPEWGAVGSQNSTAASAWNDQNYDAQTAELAALKEKYPSIPDEKKAKNLRSQFNARPAEVVAEAQVNIVNRAQENLEDLKPGEGATGAQWDAYEAALDAEVTKLSSDPNSIASILFGGEEAINRDIARHRSRLPNTANTAKAASVAGGAVAALSKPSVSNSASAPYAADFAAAEEKYGLPPGLLASVANHESYDPETGKLDPFAVSTAGAQGLMQIMPTTWDEHAPKVGAKDPFNPQQSIEVSAAYLAWLWKQLPEGKKNIEGWMTAYNYGIGHMLAGKEPPPETVAYAKAIANEVQGQPLGSVTGGQQGVSLQLPVAPGTIVNQGYGENVDDYKEWNDMYGHEGIDYRMEIGTPVMSAGDGTVEFVGKGQGFGNYGNYVVINHGNGVKTYYAHLSEFDVQQGDSVTAGQEIALSGNSGRTSGPHLHFAVRVDGDTSGPYGMVDPQKYFGKAQEAVAAAPSVSPVAQASTAASTAGVPRGAPVAPTTGEPPKTERVALTPTAKTGKGEFPFTMTPAEMIEADRNRNKGPAQIQAEERLEGAFNDMEERAKATYPDFATLYDQYRGLTDNQKQDWKTVNPMIRAMHMVAYSPAEWQQLETTFGKGVVEKWAQIPPYTGVDSDDRSQYYHQYPKTFLANAWIKGRPEVYDESAFDPTKPFEYNFGKDYEEAKKLFGPKIWDTVEQYYKIPVYEKGAENLEWKAFKKAHPEHDQWRAWWYAKLGFEVKPFQEFQPWQQFGSGFGRNSSGGSGPTDFYRVPFRPGDLPKYEGGSGDGGSDWRKYFNVPEPNLKGWRR